ncbi:MAG TPA: MFS transporter [Terriglobales bacterium]|nr:MFS transporter [Terriglobales bacterium]
MGAGGDEAGGLRRFAPALVLLAFSLLINYVDRGNLSIAAPLLKDELRISASQLGVLLSTFFLTYTAFQCVSGWLVDRFDENQVMAAGYLVWSLATAATGLVQGFAALLVMRLLLGAGESVVFPASSKMLAKYLPEHERGFANGVITAGMKSGPAVGTFGAGLLMAKYGWRPVFIGIGLASLLWLPAWWRWEPRGHGIHGPAVRRAPSFVDILRRQSFWGAAMGHFCSNYVLYFLLTWLPFYLVHERHLSMDAMARTAGIYYLVDAASALATGWLADLWIRKGGTPTRVRKSAMLLGHTTAAIALGGCALAGPDSYRVWLMVAGVGCGMAGAGVFAFAQTLAGAPAAGKWAGLQNTVGNLAGVVGPALTGFVVQWTGSFLAPFAISAAVAIAGGLAWVFGVERLEPVAWSGASESEPVSAGDVA